MLGGGNSGHRSSSDSNDHLDFLSTMKVQAQAANVARMQVAKGKAPSIPASSMPSTAQDEVLSQGQQHLTFQTGYQATAHEGLHFHAIPFSASSCDDTFAVDAMNVSMQHKLIDMQYGSLSASDEEMN